MKTNNKERLLASSLMAGMAALGAPLAIGVGALAIATDAHAQQSYTNLDLSGRVADSTGAAIGGATVTAVSSQGVTRSATTAADGTFRFAAVPGGDYSVTVAASGFDTADTIINVAPGAANFAFTLARAGSDEIVVTAARVRDFNRTDTGSVFNVQELASQIPLGRTINSAVMLTPTVSLADPTIVANGVRRNQSGVSLSGTSAAESAYYINGMNVTDLRTFLGYADLPFDFIQTIEVKTGGYSAEFGRGTGGVVNIVTRSGSNEWHGGLSLSYAPNSLREDRGLAYAPGGTGNVGQLTYNQWADAESQEGTVWASGPIIPDHLFIFGIYNAREFDNRGALGFAAPNSANGTVTDTTANDPRYGLKIDFVLNEDHRIEATYFNDEETTDYQPYNVAASTMQITGPLPRRWQDSGGETTIVQYTGSFTDWFTLTALYGKNRSSYLDYGPAVDLPGIRDQGFATTLDVGPGRQGGPYNRLHAYDERTSYRINADFYFNLLGEHHVRVGGDREDLFSLANQTYSGGALYNAFADNSTSCTGNANDQGCLRIRTYASTGAFDATQDAYYIQDSWDITDRLSIQLGIRQDIYDYKNQQGESFVNIDDQYAPRLGFEWRPFADGLTRITGSFGDYYLPIATNTSIRAASGEQFFDAFYTATRTGPCLTTASCSPLVLDANGYPVLGGGGTPYRVSYLSPPGIPDTRGVVEQELEPMYEREFTLGISHEFDEGLLNGWTLGVTFTHRNLESTIEDTAIGDALDRYCQRTSASICSGFLGTSYVSYYPFVLVNPGDGARVFVDMEADSRFLSPGVPNPAFNPVYVDLTAADLALPEAERKYDALTFTFERPFDGHWGLQGSYTLGHSQGNYEGAVKSDIGQTDSSITQDFDHAVNMLGAYGDLPNDHRHTLKLYGTYAPFERFTIGANLVVQSGRPYGCIGYGRQFDPTYAPFTGTPGAWACPQGATTTAVDPALVPQLTALGLPTPYLRRDSVLVGRGNAGRTDWVEQLDLNFAYRFIGDDDGSGHQLVGTVDIFNVFDGDAVTRVVEQGEVSAASAAQTGVAAPFYGLPRTYQAPRSVRFGLRYSF